MDIIIKEISKILSKDRKVIEYIEPEKLKTLFNLDHGNVLSEVDKIIRYSVNTNSIYFFNQLYTGKPYMVLLENYYQLSLIQACIHMKSLLYLP